MLLCAGVDYKSAPIDIREKFAFDDARAVKIINKLCGVNGVSGCVVVSTCNRSELYISAEEQNNIRAEKLFMEFANVGEELSYAVNTYIGEAVAYHLFETVCGLNSAIKREEQIITQISKSVDLSREHSCTDAELDVLFRTAVATGKRAVSINDSTRGTSLAYKAVERLEKACQSLNNKKCLVIGNGQIGRLAARLLADKGARVTMTLRTYRHGESVIPSGCNCVPYADRVKAAEDCDILISATKSPHYTLTGDMVKNKKMPKYFVDLAVPRDIEQGAIGIDTVYYNIDDFVTDEIEDYSAVYEIIEQGMAEYMSWFNYREAIESIEEIKDIIAKRIVKSLGCEKQTELVRLVSEKTADMIFGGMKNAINPQVIEECRKKIKDRSRL